VPAPVSPGVGASGGAIEEEDPEEAQPISAGKANWTPVSKVECKASWANAGAANVLSAQRDKQAVLIEAIGVSRKRGSGDA